MNTRTEPGARAGTGVLDLRVQLERGNIEFNDSPFLGILVAQVEVPEDLGSAEVRRGERWENL